MKLSPTQKTLRLVLIAASAIVGFAGAEAAEEAPLKGVAQLDISKITLPTLDLPNTAK